MNKYTEAEKLLNRAIDILKYINSELDKYETE